MVGAKFMLMVKSTFFRGVGPSALAVTLLSSVALDGRGIKQSARGVRDCQVQ